MERSFHKIEGTFAQRPDFVGLDSQDAMARPRAFDTEEALETAMRVFWERGYEATSIQDLVDALGVNRASLYSTFGDKAQLFDAALALYCTQSQRSLGAYLAPPNQGREAVAAYFAATIERLTQPGMPQGCLLLNTAALCSTAPPKALELAERSLRDNEDAFHAALARDPALAGRTDLRALARFFAAQAHGLGMLARTGLKAPALKEAAAIAVRALDAGPRRPAS
jgi:TetR/AcrR family transcriptional regulator, transcriptional repressor for nem operon